MKRNHQFFLILENFELKKTFPNIHSKNQPLHLKSKIYCFFFFFFSNFDMFFLNSAYEGLSIWRDFAWEGKEDSWDETKEHFCHFPLGFGDVKNFLQIRPLKKHRGNFYQNVFSFLHFLCWKMVGWIRIHVGCVEWAVIWLMNGSFNQFELKWKSFEEF